MKTRRDFITDSAAFAALGLGGCWGGTRSILPARALAASPNYWCTWCAQDAAFTAGVLADRSRRPKGGNTTRDGIDEITAFGKDGFASFFPESRSELMLVFDDGWDVPYGAQPRDCREFAAMFPHPQRFPSFKGTPAERLAELVARSRDAGWGGVGLWTCAQAQCEYDHPDWKGLSAEEEWKRKFDWFAKAGVRYLKVDWGNRCGDVAFRRMLSRVRDQVAPEVLVEHCVCQIPLSGFDEKQRGGSGRRLVGPEDAKLRDLERQILPFSDCWRIYDWYDPLVVPQALDRTLCDLKLAEETGSKAIVSTEDCVYLGVGLGCAFGGMRGPWQPHPGFFPEGQEKCLRLKELDRAVRWARLAPAFGPTDGFGVRWSEEVLSDSWRVTKENFWFAAAHGLDVVQGAPARISRGLPLPEVRTAGSATPYVACARHPNGALSALALPRVQDGAWRTPLADVTLAAELTPGVPLGVFGRFGSLAVRVQPGCRVFAQDLADGRVHDLTEEVHFESGKLVLPGALLARIGKECDTDASQPGTLVWTA